jgi:hypothetical protein
VRPGCFGLNPFGVVASGDQQDGRGVDADAVELEQPWRGGGGELCEDAVEGVVVLVEGEHASSEGAHGELGGVGDGVPVSARAQSGGDVGELVAGHASEAFAQFIGCAETQVAQLVETGDARLAAGALGDQQGPHGFHVAVRRLGDTLRARPDRTARAASTASTVSDLPSMRRS